MTQYDVLSIGHPSLDYNIDYLDNQIIEIGGAVIYSSASAHALGHKAGVLTKLAEKDFDRLTAFVIPKEDVYCLPSSVSTSIRNKYHTADKERRTCTCIAQADPISALDIPTGVTAKIYHVAGLIYGDYDKNIIKDLAKLGDVAVDVQCLLRHNDKATGSMYFEDWADKMEMLPYIKYLKTDTAEAEILTGTTDRIAAAKMLHSWGAKEVVITHNTEVLAYDGANIYTCPIVSRNLSGRSGRGDTTFAAYISERLFHSVKESLDMATATVSLKMEKPGPITATRFDIENYIKLMYKE